MSLAIIPGSYDPPTLGHVELIRRAARLFDRVIALVMVNDQKQALFSLEERFSLVKESVAGIPGAEADFFGGMTYDYIRDHGVDAIVKGLRNAQDFTYECEIARFNQLHAPQAETLFLYAEPRWDHVSSSRVKEAFLAGEVPVGASGAGTNLHGSGRKAICWHRSSAKPRPLKSG